jgi:hypothetical protein
MDLSGGLGDEREYILAERPADPEMRESVNAWIWDRGSEVGMPRIGIEAVGATWESHQVQLNLAYADGRAFRLWSSAGSRPPFGADGKPRILGAGPLSFELVEPYRRWQLRFDGRVHASTVRDQIASKWPKGEPDVPVTIELDLLAAAPPWENGALLESARKVLAEQEEGAMMGGPRFEQLSRATGRLRIGDAEHRIDGGALRIRRQGIRHTATTFRGHAWQSALFPSGRGFGTLVYPDREDGLPTYNEGYLFEGEGELVPARVVKAPWLTRTQPSGEDVSVVLETARGTTTIRGTSILSTFAVIPGMGVGVPVLQQALARYTWDGESANGMLERSMPSAKVAIG